MVHLKSLYLKALTFNSKFEVVRKRRIQMTPAYHVLVAKSFLLVSSECEYIPGESKNQRVIATAHNLHDRYALQRFQVDRLHHGHLSAQTELTKVIRAHHIHFAVVGQEHKVVIAARDLHYRLNISAHFDLRRLRIEQLIFSLTIYSAPAKQLTLFV
jgi:hypothetical protein